MGKEDLFPSRRISAFKGDFARSGSFLHASASLLFSQGFLLLSCALAAYAVHPEDVYVEETQNRPSRLRVSLSCALHGRFLAPVSRRNAFITVIAEICVLNQVMLTRYRWLHLSLHYACSIAPFWLYYCPSNC